MKPRSYTSEGIVLTRKNYKEADRILTVFSKNYGKLHLLAKGVRYPKSRKRGHIEVFSQIKFSASCGKGFDLITEVETINSFRLLREDLKKVAVAYFFVEVINQIMKEEEKNEEIYNLCLYYLERLGESANLRKLRVEYVNQLLVRLGFWPAGKKIKNPDKILEDVIEKKLSTLRVGKSILI